MKLLKLTLFFVVLLVCSALLNVIYATNTIDIGTWSALELRIFTGAAASVIAGAFIGFHLSDTMYLNESPFEPYRKLIRFLIVCAATYCALAFISAEINIMHAPIQYRVIMVIMPFILYALSKLDGGFVVDEPIDPVNKDEN